MPARTPENLAEYKIACEKVLERSNGFCEVLLEGKRCSKFIGRDNATYTNFAHTDSRNGQTSEWVNDPDNIVFSCVSHHIKEHQTGEKLVRCDYSEVNYIQDEN